MNYPQPRTTIVEPRDIPTRTPQRIVIDPRDRRRTSTRSTSSQSSRTRVTPINQSSGSISFEQRALASVSRVALQRLVRVAFPLGRVLDVIDILMWLTRTQTTPGQWDFTGYEVVCGPVAPDPTYILGPYYYGPGHANICGQSGGVTFYSDLHGAPNAVPSYRTGGFSMVMGRDYITGLAARINIIQVWKPIETEGPPIVQQETESYTKRYYIPRQLPTRYEQNLVGHSYFRRTWRRWQEQNLVERDEQGYSVSNTTAGATGRSSNSSRNMVSAAAGPGAAGRTESRTPPPRRTKESKLRGTPLVLAMLRILNRAYGSLVDYRDVQDALWEAIPKKLRKAKTIAEKQEEIYRHWNEIDVEKALRGIIKELLEDVVGGAGARLRSELGLRNDRPNIGYNTGFKNNDGLGVGTKEQSYWWEQWLLNNT